MSDDTDFAQPPVLYPTGFTQDVGDASNGDVATREGSGEGEEEQQPAQKEFYCGCGPWHPPWLQVFRDGRVFTFLLCLASTIEGALVSGFTSVVLSSIERRYQLPSTATGAIASTFDVAVLISVIFISYFSGRGHKPRWLGVGLIVMATGSFVFALPQFVFGRYDVGSTGSQQLEACLDGADFSSDCSSGNGFALAFFLIANLLIGAGAAPLFTVGTSYLDEIIHPKYVSIHLGIFYMLTVVGPALGYALGGLFLSIYVDPWVDTHLQTSDPGWVGAWWLCFLFCGVTSLLIALPFFLYPRLLPNSRAIKDLRQQEMAKRYKSKYSDHEHRDYRAVLKSFPLHLKQVVTNLSWLFITIAICVSFIVVSGFASFGPKYVESQFGLSSSLASIAVGAVAIPTGGAGVVVGGLFIYFLKVKGRWVALFNVIISFISFFPLLGLLVHCSTLDLVGVTVPYPDGTVDLADTSALNSTCTTACNCTSSVFEPVCGTDGYIYFSPCQAGCFKSGTGGDAVFENCTCIADQLSSTFSSSFSFSDVLYANSTASEGLCDRGCGWRLALFLVLIGLSLFLVFMLQIPNVIITIRCVAEEQRTLALGVQSFMFRLFGSIPGPLLFGVIFDSTCVFWQQDCGRRGNCWVYDNTALSTRATILASLATVSNVVFSFFCWISYPRHDVGGGGGSEEEKEVAIGGRAKGEEEESEGSGDMQAVELQTSVIARMETHTSRTELLDEVGNNRRLSTTL